MKKLIALAVIALLAACKEAPPETHFAPISVGGQQYRLNVAQVRIENNTAAQPNDVLADFPVTPAAALEQWAREHVIAAGSGGYAVVSIDDASVKEIKLQKTEGVKGFFTDDQDARYDGRVAATIRIYDGVNALSLAEVTMNATRSRSINEKATLAQREAFYYGLTRDLIVQFDQQAEPRMRQYFGNYLRY